MLCLVASVTPGLTQTINLGTAAAYGALAPRSISSTGNTAVRGNLGIEGKTLVGFPPATVSGIMNLGTTAVTQAVTDAGTARIAALALTPTSTLTAIAADAILVPGVYEFERAAIISGNFTLSGNGTFVFQIKSTLTVETGSNVLLTGGVSSEDVFWAIESTASFADMVGFEGTVMASASITIGAASTINGGVYAGDSITLDDNTVGLVVSTN